MVEHKGDTILVRVVIEYLICMNAYFYRNHGFRAVGKAERRLASGGFGSGPVGPQDLWKFFCPRPSYVIKFGFEHVDYCSVGDFDLPVCLLISQ